MQITKVSNSLDRFDLNDALKCNHYTKLKTGGKTCVETEIFREQLC